MCIMHQLVMHAYGRVQRNKISFAQFNEGDIDFNIVNQKKVSFPNFSRDCATNTRGYIVIIYK